jgi:hypothetical protein
MTHPQQSCEVVRSWGFCREFRTVRATSMRPSISIWTCSWICCSSAWEASSYGNRISHEVLESSNYIAACLSLWLLILQSRIILHRIRLEKHQRTLLQQAQAWRWPLLLLCYILPWNEQLHTFGSSVEGELGPNNKLKKQHCVLTARRSLYTSNLHSITESCKLLWLPGPTTFGTQGCDCSSSWADSMALSS